MSFYFHKTPAWIQYIFPNRIWYMDSSKKEIYLSFDDGPHPGITPYILDILYKFSAKVTFFQLGSKVIEYPDLHNLCLSYDHVVANHGFDHLDARITKPDKFVENLERGKQIIDSSIYRPAYGRLPVMRRSDIFRDNKIVMWNVNPGDFDSSISADKCRELIIKYTECGSIILMHENEKAKKKILSVLPDILDFYSNKGFEFKSIKV